MKKKGFQFLLGMITASAVVVGVGYRRIIPAFPVYSGPTLVIETSSPDGKYVARSERKSNGRDWCEERTTIDASGTRSDWGREYVFVNRCHVPIEMAWTSNTTLRISYGYDAAGKSYVSRQAFSKDGQVAIEYEFVGVEGR